MGWRGGSQATERLQKAIPTFVAFCRTYLRDRPRADNVVRIGSGFGGEERAMCIPEVLDIEENVWAPKYGLKGMIDASLHISLHPPSAVIPDFL